MINPTDSPNPNQPDANPPPSASVAGECAADLGEIRRERDELRDLLQRKQAEFLNYQKRARNQANLDRQYATGNLAHDLLAVLDNLERAIDAARAANQPTLIEGLDLVYRQFLAAFAKHGVEPIPALGGPFDPNVHEAITQQPDPSQPEGTVVGELAKGYKHHDRVLRPTRVVVSTKP